MAGNGKRQALRIAVGVTVLSIILLTLAQAVLALDANAVLSVHSKAKVESNNDTITSGIQLVQYSYGMSVYNTNDASDTVLGNIEYTLQGDNIVDVQTDHIVDVEYDKYAYWNNTYVKWVFPSNIFLVEDDWLWTEAETGFETKYVPFSISRKMNKSIFDAEGYQLAEFNVTYDEINFEYSGGTVQAWGNSFVNVSFVENTFSTDAPLNPEKSFSKKNEHRIDFNLDKSNLTVKKPYNFSVVVRGNLIANNPPSSIFIAKPYSLVIG